MGWLEVAPYVYFPKDQSFSPGPGSLVAGAKWEQLSLIAQQLFFDLQADYTSAEFYNALEAVRDTASAAKKAGGKAQYLDAASETALKAASESLLDGVETSEDVDGNSLNKDVAKSIEKWTTITEELGYTEDGDFENFDTWYKGSEDFEDREYLKPISDRIFEEIVLPHRPE